MKLSLKERIELSLVLNSYNSDETSEMELVECIYNKTVVTKSERAKFKIEGTSRDYFIEFEHDKEIEFSSLELKLLKKIHGAIESTCRVNLRNLSLCLKLRAIEIKEQEPA